MVISFAEILFHKFWFFHEVPVYRSSELDAYGFTKAGWFVVPYGLCISECVKYWIGSENLLWEVRKLACRRFWANSVGCGYCCKILDDFLGVLRLINMWERRTQRHQITFLPAGLPYPTDRRPNGNWFDFCGFDGLTSVPAFQVDVRASDVIGVLVDVYSYVIFIVRSTSMNCVPVTNY